MRNAVQRCGEVTQNPSVFPTKAGHLSSVTDKSQKFVPVCQRPFRLQRYGIVPNPMAKIEPLREVDIRKMKTVEIY